MPTKTKTTKPGFAGNIAASNQRINDAVAQLFDSERGRAALANFRGLMDGGASGLDTVNADALITLLQEALKGGRRDFISQLPKPPIKTPPGVSDLVEAARAMSQEYCVAGLNNIHCYIERFNEALETIDAHA